MKVDTRKIYADPNEFYVLEGSFAMILEPQAAMSVCESSFDHGQLISRIEGGIWSDNKFQPRGDCIWDGADPPIRDEDARTNNAAASRFIKMQVMDINAFVLTTALIKNSRQDQRGEKGNTQ